MLAAGPAAATYEGNDGRLYFGAFDPAAAAQRRPLLHAHERRRPQAADRGRHSNATSAPPCRQTASGSRCAATGPATTRSGRWRPTASRSAQLTSLGGYSIFPDFSPSGEDVAFTHGAADGPDSPASGWRTRRAARRTAWCPPPTAPGLWADAYPAYSPDGSTVLFVRQRLEIDPSEGFPFPVEGQLWTYDLSSGVSTQLTFDATVKDQVPDWSPDGSRIAFGADDDVYVIDADGSDLVNLTSSPASEFGAAWSPRGGWIAFTGGGGDVPAGQRYVQVVRPDGTDRQVVAPTPGLLQAVPGLAAAGCRPMT